MTAAFDLTSWRDTVIRGGIPAPARTERWQPLRAGVVNLWEYDAAEVWYADGRLQLQGANESGKSTLMTLTTLLLIAGDISSNNIDTLGQTDKRFRYYVEPTGHALDRRDATQAKNRGWAWLEFGSVGGGGNAEYYTLLLFAESRRADGALKVQWCTAHGSARVRSGLALAKSGVVAEPGQFRDLPGFTVHRSGTAYREDIARTLYGSNVAWLDQVIRILRVVRTPQIGHRLDLRFLTDAFRVALPPVSDDEINQLADGWEQLQRLRDERDTTDQALSAVTEFTRQRWRPWADSVIRAAADPVAAVTSRLTQITREEKSASDAVLKLKGEASALTERIDVENNASQVAVAQREALRESQLYQDAVSASLNAQQLAERADGAEQAAKRSRQRADEAQRAIEPAEARLAKASENLDNAERAVVTAAGNVARYADHAGLVEVTARFLPDRDTERLRQAARLRITAADEARRRIAVHAKAAAACETAAAKAHEARGRAAAAQRLAAQRERTVEGAITAVAELLSHWARTLDERIRPAAELTEGWIRRVSELTAADKPTPVLGAAISRDYFLPTRRPLDQRRAEADRALQDNAKAHADAEAERAAVEAERDPRPRDPEYWLRRERPDGVSTTGAPLWRLVERVEPDTPVAQLEAAMDAAGLLQAWISPDGAYVTDRDGGDVIWTALSGSGPPSRPARSLQAVLRPGDDAGALVGVVAGLLASVSYGDDLAAEGTAIGTDGRWRHGGLTGVAAPRPEGARLLGAAARAADRARRIAELRVRLDGLAAERERLAADLAGLDELLAALDSAAERLPGDSEVVSAILRARDAAKAAEDTAEEATIADQAERTARSAADTATADVARHCAEHDLPRTSEEVEAVLRALTEYQSAISSLVSAMSLVPPLRTAASQAVEVVEQCRAIGRSAEEDAASDDEAALGLRAKADAARASLTKEAQEILEEVRRLARRIEEATQTLKALAKDHVNLAGRKIRAETILEQVEERREQAEAERKRCVDRWLGCIDSGLPRLRGLEDPPARHVTAALESVRAARATISVRDWPDDPDAAAHRVQVQWVRMTEAVAMLRSRLESLAGRTIRTVTPGDGDQDFPGAVEVVVDSTGAALPPPTAVETLSALLQRLQTDYDEELTKTINDLLGSTFIEHLRDRLAEAERLRSDINAKLAQNPTSVSGLTLRLIRMPVSEERAANDVLASLERDFSLLPESTQEQLRGFLAGRVSDAQEKARAAGDPDWRSGLAEILDYRRWFELRMEYRTPRSGLADGSAGGWRALDRGDHGLLSGGAKVVTLMQPFIAALHAMYDQSGIGPRMIWLDEAFGGVDSANKAAMFRLLASCDLDWLIAGPVIIANSSTVPLASIYEVRRAPQPLPGVSLELAVWTGNELTHIPTPDPADLVDLAAGDPSEAADDLFSVL
ncbi:MAG: TIGR02680 family protein [Streptosporangiaceae bacterium]